ncbi:hypothetical protein L1887_52094 [Cichorium endivia]|nr:hypothetical protein L1887_52094 [Cichorium endivia]
MEAKRSAARTRGLNPKPIPAQAGAGAARCGSGKPECVCVVPTVRRGRAAHCRSSSVSVTEQVGFARLNYVCCVGRAADRGEPSGGGGGGGGRAGGGAGARWPGLVCPSSARTCQAYADRLPGASLIRAPSRRGPPRPAPPHPAPPRPALLERAARPSAPAAPRPTVLSVPSCRGMILLKPLVEFSHASFPLCVYTLAGFCCVRRKSQREVRRRRRREVPQNVDNPRPASERGGAGRGGTGPAMSPINSLSHQNGRDVYCADASAVCFIPGRQMERQSGDGACQPVARLAGRGGGGVGRGWARECPRGPRCGAHRNGDGRPSAGCLRRYRLWFVRGPRLIWLMVVAGPGPRRATHGRRIPLPGCFRAPRAVGAVIPSHDGDNSILRTLRAARAGAEMNKSSSSASSTRKRRRRRPAGLGSARPGRPSPRPNKASAWRCTCRIDDPVWFMVFAPLPVWRGGAGCWPGLLSSISARLVHLTSGPRRGGKHTPTFPSWGRLVPTGATGVTYRLRSSVVRCPLLEREREREPSRLLPCPAAVLSGALPALPCPGYRAMRRLCGYHPPLHPVMRLGQGCVYEQHAEPCYVLHTHPSTPALGPAFYLPPCPAPACFLGVEIEMTTRTPGCRLEFQQRDVCSVVVDRWSDGAPLRLWWLESRSGGGARAPPRALYSPRPRPLLRPRTVDADAPPPPPPPRPAAAPPPPRRRPAAAPPPPAYSLSGVRRIFGRRRDGDTRRRRCPAWERKTADAHVRRLFLPVIKIISVPNRGAGAPRCRHRVAYTLVALGC